MFYIRADGNEKIGMGHIMRCLSIAQALRAAGRDVMFLTADEKPSEVIASYGFEYHILFTYYDEMDVELPQLVMLLPMGAEKISGQSNRPEILIDSYYVTPFYLQNLQLTATVILMDDLKTRVFPCDILVNYNIYAQNLGYEKEYSLDTKLLLGHEYAPLRPEFAVKPEPVREDVKNILLTTGGGDSCHMALAFAKEIIGADARQKSVSYHIVCGPFSTDTGKLKELAAECPQIQIHEQVSDMAKLMKACDLAVSAAGSTFYELCALGIPTVGFYFAANQRMNMEAFSEKTPILNAGDFSADPQQVLFFIKKEIEILSESYELRLKISQAVSTLVDGKGAERLAAKLCSRTSTQIKQDELPDKEGTE